MPGKRSATRQNNGSVSSPGRAAPLPVKRPCAVSIHIHIFYNNGAASELTLCYYSPPWSTRIGRACMITAVHFRRNNKSLW